jgi:hypothetical protein
MKSSCCFSLRSLRSSLRLCVKPLVILRLCVKPLVILRLCVKPLVILNPVFHSLSDFHGKPRRIPTDRQGDIVRKPPERLA